MISIRKYLYGQDSGAEGRPAEELVLAVARLATELMSGVETHVFQDAHPRLAVFREELRKLRERLESDGAVPSEFEDAGGAVLSLLEQHRRTREEMAEAEAGEVQKIIAMLNQTVTVLSSGSERSIARLTQIEDDLKRASMIGDIVALKARLNETMRYVREQSAREREESARTLAEIERDVQRAQESFAVSRSGLPGRGEAEQSLRDAMAKRDRVAVAVFVLERAASIKQRFGSTVSERFFSLFAQDLANYLPLPKRLFRWTDSSIVMELETSGPVSTLRAEVRAYLAAMPHERRLDVGQRLAVFSNSHRWTMIPLADTSTAAEALRRVEQFVSA